MHGTKKKPRTQAHVEWPRLALMTRSKHQRKLTTASNSVASEVFRAFARMSVTDTGWVTSASHILSRVTEHPTELTSSLHCYYSVVKSLDFTICGVLDVHRYFVSTQSRYFFKASSAKNERENAHLRHAWFLEQKSIVGLQTLQFSLIRFFLPRAISPDKRCM